MISFYILNVYILTNRCLLKTTEGLRRERETDRQTYIQTDRDRQRNRSERKQVSL